VLLLGPKQGEYAPFRSETGRKEAKTIMKQGRKEAKTSMKQGE